MKRRLLWFLSVLLSTSLTTQACAAEIALQKVWSVSVDSRIYAAPLVADVNADGAMEIVVSQCDGKRITVLSAFGSEIASVPVGGDAPGDITVPNGENWFSFTFPKME